MAEDELRQAVKGHPGWRVAQDGRATYRVRGTDRRGVVRPILASADRRARWHAAIDLAGGSARTLTTETARAAVAWTESHLIPPAEPASGTKQPRRGGDRRQGRDHAT